MSSSDSQGIDLSEVFAPIYWDTKDRGLVRNTAYFMLFLDLASSALVAQSVFYYLVSMLAPYSNIYSSHHQDDFSRYPTSALYCPLTPLPRRWTQTRNVSIISCGIELQRALSGMPDLYDDYFHLPVILCLPTIRRYGQVKRLGNWGRWVVLGSISASAIMAFAGGVACVTSMYVFKHGVLSNRSNMFAIFFGVAKGFGAMTDILATIAMCLYLSSSRTGIAQTNSLLNYIMGFVIHRGVLVTLIQTLLLITFYAIPGRLYCRDAQRAKSL
ncbi:hypothetical protein H0H92_014192 [Tricholoma furcatifolium]|nr:hypothetical protein H0H92_014192 [Tricholoma furcatifolium]